MEAFEKLAKKEFFWLDIVSPLITKILIEKGDYIKDIILKIKEIKSFSKVFCQVTDFRSRFTATHSNGVALISKELANLAGFNEDEKEMMEVAGYLHDIGKLNVPERILEKPGKLTEDEYAIMKSHVYHSYRVLDKIKNFETVNRWASLHHEKVDGSGYPFHYKLKELTIGSRIMAVTDIFTALSEDRPYREGMNIDKVIKIIKTMSNENKLDKDVVDLLIENNNYLNELRIETQSWARRHYENFGTARN